MTRAPAPWLSSLMVLAACASGTGAPPPDGAEPDSAEPDTGVTAGQCLEEWSDGVREVDPYGPDTQIHTEVRFDGARLWFTWNRPNAANGFDVWAVQTRCDGAPVGAPIEVSDSLDNEVDPTLAFLDGRILLAWTSSSDTSGLGVRYRVLTTEGAAVSDATTFEGTRAGEPVTGNVMAPSLDADGERFLLAGSWGHGDAPAFQAFTQPIDADGAPAGESTDVELDTENGQTVVKMVVHDAQPWVAWQEDSLADPDPRAWMAPLGSAPTQLGTTGARPSLTASPAGVWSAWDDNEGGIFVRPPGAEPVALDLGGGFFHSPQLASSGDTVVVLVMELDTGVYNDLKLVTLDQDGVLDALPVEAEGAPSPYAASVAMIDPNHAVVAWQEGDNPAFRSRAEWISW